MSKEWRRNRRNKPINPDGIYSIKAQIRFHENKAVKARDIFHDLESYHRNYAECHRLKCILSSRIKKINNI